ncbi:hypothetical protein BKA70DRAFT_1402739 [Coprinopsis sp. MPI-PUGE-AT-0042]|nr:hypothetical protein BKA70DRAFT_1402739 [Coprinopsis sp. MPI-PUGE-AT-0042]
MIVNQSRRNSLFHARVGGTIANRSSTKSQAGWMGIGWKLVEERRDGGTCEETDERGC